jgi:hypothetical protein
MVSPDLVRQAPSSASASQDLSLGRIELLGMSL